MDGSELFANYIVPLIGILGVGGMMLLALKMVLNYRMARLGSGVGKDAERVNELVEHMREQLEQNRAEMVELHERVDFAERMLAKSRGEELPPGKLAR
jgi:hypothetical protein